MVLAIKTVRGSDVALGFFGALLVLAAFYGALYGIIWSTAPASVIAEDGEVDLRQVAIQSAIVLGFLVAFFIVSTSISAMSVAGMLVSNGNGKSKRKRQRKSQNGSQRASLGRANPSRRSPFSM